ncbi:hypothetical protein [Streptomyces siamensis]
MSGARRRDALSHLLAVTDLSEGWQLVDERTWWTGRRGPATEWGTRARRQGSVTAWRSFHDGKGRWMWIQVVPLATRDDADTALHAVKERLLGNTTAAVEVVGERDVHVQPIVGATAMWAREQQVRSADGAGGGGVALLMAAAVDSNVLVLNLSGDPSWDWPAARDLAARQAAVLTGASP